MAIKPILFNTDMVRAILDGRKACTRRLPRKQIEEKYLEYEEWVCAVAPPGSTWLSEKEFYEEYPPYQLGDILYVRETWCGLPVNEAGHFRVHPIYYYRADGDLRPEGWRGAWRPSIHMPKEAARIWLKVTDVWVERLQDITEDGAEAEGMPDSLDYPVDKAYCPLCKGEGIIGTVDVHSLGHMDVDCPYCDSYRKRFENLWNSIKQKSLDRYGWDASPWVWVIEFERCEKPQEV